MATINNIKKRADEIKNAYEPESVTAEDVGGVAYDLAEVAEQQAMALSDTAEGTDLALRRSDALQETLVGIGAEGGTVQNAAAVALANGTGLVATDVQGGIKELATAIFPVTVSIYEGNAGTFEAGTPITPLLKLDIKRNGVNVQSSSTVTVNPSEDMEVTTESNRKVITHTGEPLTSGTTTYQISVAQGGQTVNAPNQVFDFMNYRYYGVINSTTEPTKAQVKTLCENGTLTKQLSRSTKMGATDLAANKCFVFVVPNTSVNLIVKNARSGNPISGCTVDTVTINRVNGTDTVSCKYVIVPSGAAAWTFEITN
jgi:hypothetical protein